MAHIGTTLEEEDFVALGVFRARSGVTQYEFIREAVRVALHDPEVHKQVFEQVMRERERAGKEHGSREKVGQGAAKEARVG